MISDLVIPAPMTPYTRLAAANVNRFIKSGVVIDSPEFDPYAAGGGRQVTVPYFNPLEGVRQVLSDTSPMTVNRITTGTELAQIHGDGDAWQVNHLAKWMSGTDPLKAIVADVGASFARLDEKFIISSLKGMFAAPSMAANRLNIAVNAMPEGGFTDVSTLNGKTFIDATALLGDHSERLRTIAMHSATEAYLRKLDLIETVRGSDGKLILSLFQGRVVIIDDDLPVENAEGGNAKIFTSYLFGEGVFVRGQANLDTLLPTGLGTDAIEFERDGLANETRMMMRRRYIMHPLGMKFLIDNIAGPSPTDAELENGAYWTRAYTNPKHIRIVAIRHNVGGAIVIPG